MSTRSIIIRKTNDSKLQVIYCHWDGYPSNNGRLLLEWYRNDDKKEITELFNLGDLSILGPSPWPPPSGHSFDNYMASHCVAYRRDRHDNLGMAQLFDSMDDIFSAGQFSDTEWCYYWNGDNWYFARYPENDRPPDFNELTFLDCMNERAVNEYNMKGSAALGRIITNIEVDPSGMPSCYHVTNGYKVFVYKWIQYYVFDPDGHRISAELGSLMDALNYIDEISPIFNK